MNSINQNNQSEIEYLYGSVLEVVKKTMDSFNEIEEKHKQKQSINWDYEIGRDRKAAIVIKGALAGVHIKQAKNRENQITLDSKKLATKS